jgi:hypothetical protein
MVRFYRNIVIFIIISAIIFPSFRYLQCALSEEDDSSLKEIGFFTGYAKGSMDCNREYEPVIFLIRLGYDLKGLLKKVNFQPKGSIQFDVEPFINPILSPNLNVEFGCGFLLKYSVPVTKWIQPYFEVGTGFIYSTQHTREQATQWNFLDQAGLGLAFYPRKDFSLSLGYRYRHYSNLDFKAPNAGIDSHSIICGISFCIN